MAEKKKQDGRNTDPIWKEVDKRRQEATNKPTDPQPDPDDPYLIKQ